jgi:putative flavoprotein involved in K+ transport
MADVEALCASPATSLDLLQHSIRSVIWCTGFTSNFDYLKLPVFKEDGSIRHQKGIAAVPGLYFLALPWLRKRKSALIYGIKEDAEFICEKVYEYSQRIVAGRPESLLSRPYDKI